MQKIQGWAEQGNTTLTITGAAGTIARKVQGSFPAATITVYLTSPPPVSISAISRTSNVVTVTVPVNSGFIAGQSVTISNVVDATYNGIFTIQTATSTQFTYNNTGANGSSSGGTAASTLRLAPIFADNFSTPKANPFTAGNDATWFFYAVGGQYDVQFSGAGIAAPFTISALGYSIQTLLGPQYVNVCDFPGADAGTQINNAIAALPVSGGIADARCLSGTIAVTVTIPANITVLLGPAYTATVQAFNLTGNGATLIGLGSGQDGVGADLTPSAPTVITASGLSNTTDMIRVASLVRNTQLASKLVDARITGIAIDMAGVGRRGIYATSTSYSYYEDIKIWNGIEDGFYLEGALSTDSTINACYKNQLHFVQVQLKASNSIGNGIHLDATHGEISYTTMQQTRSSGNITNGGGLRALLLEAGTATNQSISHMTIHACYFGNPVDVAGCAGVQLKAPGTFTTQTGGRIWTIAIISTLVERLFTAVNGIGIGCTDGTNTPNNTGVGAFVLMDTGVGANWATSMDTSHLGNLSLILPNDTLPTSGPAIWLPGPNSGSNASGINVSGLYSNGTSLFGLSIQPTFSGVTNGYGIFCSASGATNNYGLRVAGGMTRVDGFLGISEDPGTSPLRIGAAVSGANANEVRIDGTVTATANTQDLFSIQNVPTFATGGFNAGNIRGLLIDLGSAISGGGTATSGIAGDFTGPTAGATLLLGVRSNGGIQMVPNIAKPTASATYRGTFWVTQGAPGTKDNVEVCAKDATDTYAWRTIY